MERFNKLSSLTLDKLTREAIKENRVRTKANGGGLTFTVSPTGFPSWVLRYKHLGRSREYTLPVAADVKGHNLVESRKVAEELRSRVKSGEDIASTKQSNRMKSQISNTLKALALDWYHQNIENKHRHPEVTKRILDKDIIPAIGDLPAAEITPLHVDNLLRKIVDRNAPTIANDVLRYLKAIFKHGRNHHFIESNPIADFDLSGAGGNEKPRDRVLYRKELIQLLNAIKDEQFGRSNELAAKLLLVLSVRKMELLGAKWKEFDLKQGEWNLPIAKGRNKTGQAQRIPLPPLVVDWLTELKVLSCRSDYLFPTRRISRTHKYPHIHSSTLNNAFTTLIAEHRLEHFTVHDLRHTARTTLAELGVQPHIAELCINHKLKGVWAIYDRHDYFDERMQALKQLSEYLKSLDEDQKVVPIKKAMDH